MAWEGAGLRIESLARLRLASSWKLLTASFMVTINNASLA